MFYKVLTLCAALAFPAFAQAPDYPPRPAQPVTDLADLLPDEAEARLTTAIEDLRKDTGIELLLITLKTRSPYAEAPTMEAFVTNLFNSWGIGDATRNDGILIYVARTDREMRIELGSGFGTDWDHVAQEVINSNFLPYFRNDSYADGVERGTNATIRDIARAFAEGTAPPARKNGSTGFFAFLAIALTGMGFAIFGKKIKDFRDSRRPCPKCGYRCLVIQRYTKKPATTLQDGSECRQVTCRNCDYLSEVETRIPYRNANSATRHGGFGGGSGGSSGGGRSSGGGASGRW